MGQLMLVSTNRFKCNLGRTIKVDSIRETKKLVCGLFVIPYQVIESN